MKNCAFTIVAKNYLGIAEILRESFVCKNRDVDFLIFIADESADKFENYVLQSKDVLNMDEALWTDMSFKYDLTEFCTSIKPFCFKYLFDNSYEKVVYLDPDCYVYNSLSNIYLDLNTYSIIVTPHIVTSELSDDKRISDSVFLQSGIYNLGFLALKKDENSLSLLLWWKQRLIHACFDDLFSYTFTDQKWMNFVSAFYSSNVLLVDRSLTLNLAPWNYFEREIVERDGSFFVKNRLLSDSTESPLIFAHFSGFDYKALLRDKVVRGRVENCRFYNDVDNLLIDYSCKLKRHAAVFLKYIDLEYSYGFYDNSVKIDLFHRRIYRKLTEYEKIVSPFNASDGVLFLMLQERGMLSRSKLDHLKLSDVSHSVSKMKFFLTIMKLLYMIIGYKRYLQFLKLLKYFSRYENQLFLIKSKYSFNIFFD